MAVLGTVLIASGIGLISPSLVDDVAEESLRDAQAKRQTGTFRGQRTRDRTQQEAQNTRKVLPVIPFSANMNRASICVAVVNTEEKYPSRQTQTSLFKTRQGITLGRETR